MKIKKIVIKRFRSILDLELSIDSLERICTICGANNVGKTNVLRSINIFFNPMIYSSSKDAPNHKYYGSRGESVFPEVTIEFESNQTKYIAKRTFGLERLEATEIIQENISSKIEKQLSEKEIESFFKKIAFFYIPSINISTPELINDLIEDIYDIEYARSRFRGLKKKLKESFEEYINGIVEILNGLAGEINPLFEEFNQDWQVGFEFTSNVQKFRDLISNDIDFFFNDKSNRHIDAKGSGLQRLGFILLHSRIINKVSKRSPILLIDEPDVYIHQGLQKKLFQHLDELCNKSQIIITSHSPIFIDSYSLTNVFLLDLEIGEKQFYKRANKDFHILKTVLVDLEKEDGFKKIREYLGISLDDYELLDSYNLMVEGGSDNRYIKELSKFFSIEPPNTIITHGVNKYEKYLDFYNSFYKGKNFRPKIRLLFDNDTAGREIYINVTKKIDKGQYANIELCCEFVPTFKGEKPNKEDVKQNKIASNFEIEDFLYPKLFIHFSNKILEKRGLNKVRWRDIENRLGASSFREKGILYNFDLAKNERNLEDGNIIDFTGKQAKEGIAKQFKLEGNRGLAKMIIDLDSEYPEVKNYLVRISKPFSMSSDNSVSDPHP